MTFSKYKNTMLKIINNVIEVLLPSIMHAIITEWVSHPGGGFLIRGRGKPLPPPSPSIDPLTFWLGVARESPCQAMVPWCQTSKPQCC